MLAMELTKEICREIEEIWGDLPCFNYRLRKYGEDEKYSYLEIIFSRKDNHLSFVKFFFKSKYYDIFNYDGDSQNVFISHGINMDIHIRICETIKMLGWLEDEPR